MNHPVLARSAKESVATRRPLTVKDHHDLVRTPLLQLERAVIPNTHVPAPVFARRNVSLERPVRQGVILGMNREVVPVRIVR